MVTLGIIGVVSAMTVPSLMQNYQRQSYVTQLHKTYNEISQALTLYQTDANAVNLKESGLVSQDAANKFIEKYFKVIEDCGEDKTPCFANSYKKMNGNELDITSSKGYTFTLASGQTINIFYNDVGIYSYLASFLVDINGAKGPNIQGRDLFELFVYNTDNGLLIDDLLLSGNAAEALSSDYRETQFLTYCLDGHAANRHGCFGKILNDNWQMTY